jgi:hypothetical protein
MAKKILSFEEYAASKNFTSKDEIAETDNEQTVETSEEEETETPEEEETEKEHEESETPEEEDDEDEEDDKEESVAEALKKCYEGCVKEAITYDNDEHPDHTLITYMQENSALVAAMAVNSLEDAHNELKDTDLTVEEYEAACNSIKDSFVKKIDEMKESWSAK